MNAMGTVKVKDRLRKLIEEGGRIWPRSDSKACTCMRSCHRALRIETS